MRPHDPTEPALLDGGPDGGPDGGVPVGVAAARLGLAPSTLRSWERRYGLAPTGRSAGGHRRYTGADLELLHAVRHLVTAGRTPAEAAREARPAPDGDLDTGSGVAATPARGRPRPGGPGGRVLAVPGGGRPARGLARAATALDADAATTVVETHLAAHGVAATWDDVLRPVLVAAGAAWARTGEGIEVEHLLTQAVTDALTSHRRRLPVAASRSPVVLACAPQDQHGLPLQVLAAALAEDGVPSRLLGTRVPIAALAATVRRTGARGVFVWAQLPDPALAGLPAALSPAAPARHRVTAVVGGPAWAGVELPTNWRVAGTLPEAVALLASASEPVVRV